MRVLLVFAASLAVATCQFDGYRNGNGNGNGRGASPVYGVPDKEPEQPKAEEYTPQVFRHVYVHVAEDEPADEQARTIKVPGGDKHVNIIFVKTPSQSSSSQTEVILPEQDEQKNLVYVLLKKAEATADIKIRKPPAKIPKKPEVYFIRYKDQEQQKEGGYSQGPPPPQQNGGYSRQPPQQNGHRQPQHSPPPPQNFDFDEPSQPAPPPSPPRQNGNGHHNGNGNGYAEAGRYSPAVAPGVIRGPADAPSSGYGVPL